MGTFRLFLRKAGRLLLTVFVISTVVFFTLRVIPGDPALVVAGIDAPPETVKAIQAKLGTDKPALVQYEEWLLSILRFDLGASLLSGEKVTDLILSRFPLTLALALMGMKRKDHFIVPGDSNVAFDIRGQRILSHETCTFEQCKGLSTTDDKGTPYLFTSAFLEKNKTNHGAVSKKIEDYKACQDPTNYNYPALPYLKDKIRPE